MGHYQVTAGTGNDSGNSSLPWHRRKPARPEDAKKNNEKKKAHSPTSSYCSRRNGRKRLPSSSVSSKLPIISTAEYNQPSACKVKKISGGVNFFNEIRDFFAQKCFFWQITPRFLQKETVFIQQSGGIRRRGRPFLLPGIGDIRPCRPNRRQRPRAATAAAGGDTAERRGKCGTFSDFRGGIKIFRGRK